MFSKYFCDVVNGKEVIYLYLNNQYEISNDIFSVNDSNIISSSASDFLKINNINPSGKNIYLVINNIIVGKLNKQRIKGSWDYKEFVKYSNSGNNIEILDENKKNYSSKFIDLRRSDGINSKLKINEYLFGVIAREMPDIFDEECLKAQAIISRTFLLKSLNSKDYIDQLNKYQLFWDRDYLRSLWKENFDLYRSKIMNAILSTDDLVIYFDNNLIECYTHYNDDGKTENSEYILNEKYPYLKSVKSFDTSNVLRYRKIGNKFLSKLLNTSINKDTDVKIIERTDGDNVRLIKFNNLVFDGAQLAKKLGLVSYNYAVNIDNDYTIFHTKGCGNGLGMSKCGAKNMAKMGYNYIQIIKHFYSNADIKKFNSI